MRTKIAIVLFVTFSITVQAQADNKSGPSTDPSQSKRLTRLTNPNIKTTQRDPTRAIRSILDGVCLADKNIQYKLHKDDVKTDERTIEFFQLINDIPLKHKSRVVINLDGTVRNVRIIQVEEVESVNVDGDYAWQQAEAALLAKFSLAALNVKGSHKKDLKYHIVKEDKPAVPIWEIRVNLEDLGASNVELNEQELKTLQAGKPTKALIEKLALLKQQNNGASGHYRVKINANDGTILQIIEPRVMNFG